MDSDARDMEQFLKLLHRISKLANDQHLKTAKFLLKERLTRKQLEKCEDMKDIFEKLIAKGLIAPNETGTLRELLTEIFDDIHITKMLDNYEMGKSEASDTASQKVTTSKSTVSRQPAAVSSKNPSLMAKPTSLPAKYHEQFEYAATRLSSDWKVLARYAGLFEHDITQIHEEYPSDSARAYKAMTIWFSQQAKASSKQLRKLLRCIPRNDIADDLQSMGGKVTTEK